MSPERSSYRTKSVNVPPTSQPSRYAASVSLIAPPDMARRSLDHARAPPLRASGRRTPILPSPSVSYRRVRNPMISSVLLMLGAESLFFGSWHLAGRMLVFWATQPISRWWRSGPLNGGSATTTAATRRTYRAGFRAGARRMPSIETGAVSRSPARSAGRRRGLPRPDRCPRAGAPAGRRADGRDTRPPARPGR